MVARDWLPAGRRLGLSEDQYDVGERGTICERLLGSTTHADNTVGPDDEGISYIRSASGAPINLAEAVTADPAAILGQDYACTHGGLGRLAKIYDFAARIPFHIHPPKGQAAKVGRNSKDEAHYFPAGVDMDPHPETFFGPGLCLSMPLWRCRKSLGHGREDDEMGRLHGWRVQLAAVAASGRERGLRGTPFSFQTG